MKDELKEELHATGSYFIWAMEDKEWKEKEELLHIAEWLNDKYCIQIVIEPCNIDNTYKCYLYRNYSLDYIVINTPKEFRFKTTKDAYYKGILKALSIIQYENTERRNNINT